MKKKYVFSFISFYDNDLTSKVIESDLGPLEVAIQEMIGRGWIFTDEIIQTLDDLKRFAFDCEGMFEIIEV